MNRAGHPAVHASGWFEEGFANPESEATVCVLGGRFWREAPPGALHNDMAALRGLEPTIRGGVIDI